jgi:hypothetical protein
MGVKTQPRRPGAAAEDITPLNESQKAAVLRALEDIRTSKAFRASKRCKQFLSYLVERTLEGQTELLKERTLGVELCNRLPTYMTGEDPVVRVEAGEVRRRLLQFYTAEAQSPEVRIEIPVGSYIPEFRWGQPAAPAPTSIKAGLPTGVASYLLTILLTVMVMTGIFTLILRHKSANPASVLDDFWAPLFRTPQPVLICVQTPVVYLPSNDLYDRYKRLHPGAYQTEGERSAVPLGFDPNEQVPWKDMIPHVGWYVNREDAFVAAQMLSLLDRIGKPSQIKGLDGLSIRDLRNSPAVLIGAFNNRWTMELGGKLPFFFQEGEHQVIREQAPPGRVWYPHFGENGKLTRDFAIVSRLINSSTGQDLFVAAGIEGQGTEAAGEILSHPDYLSNVLHSAPPGWQKMNFQAVLQTDVTDGVAGPPQVVATRFW